jgi:hypothetical protein
MEVSEWLGYPGNNTTKAKVNLPPLSFYVLTSKITCSNTLISLCINA